jgi:hypothetical protein
MKKLLMLTSMLLIFMSSNSQNIVLNEATTKYEMIIDFTAKTNNQNDNFDNIEEWLVTNYANKYSSSKLSNKEKGKIIYGAAFETRIFLSKGLISFNYTIKLDKNKINFYITDFAYTIIGQTTAAGVVMNFESKGLAGKKKIIKETETKILEALTKLQL